MKIRPVGAEFFPCGRTDMRKPTVAFRNVANAPKNLRPEKNLSPSQQHSSNTERATHPRLKKEKVAYHRSRGQVTYEWRYTFTHPYACLMVSTGTTLHTLENRLTDTRTSSLTLYLLTCRIWWVPNNASKWQMGFNLASKWLNINHGKRWSKDISAPL